MKLHSALACVGIAALAVTAGCGKSQDAKDAEKKQMPPPEVGVVEAKATSVPLVQELVGRLSPLRSADVRARVPGVLKKRSYTEGTDVEQGQVLFEIDPAPLKAALNAQLANLAAAKATYTNNHVAAERARSVGSKGYLSKADVDNANAAERTAAASVKQVQADVDTAKINLSYTKVTAPISGRAGKQQVTEGALVGQGDTTLLTTVDQIDPVYVNFSQAVGVIDDLRRQAASGSVGLVEPNKAKIEILGPDGHAYTQSGVLDFADAQVDAATGAVTLRGSVPNPDHALLPGMYVNVRLTIGEIKHAWLISQLAVQRDTKGAYVFVVGADDKVVQKRIKAESQQGADWIVTDGLADGDRIVVSGVQKVKADAPAKPVPYQPGQENTAPAGAPAQGKSADQAPAKADAQAPANGAEKSGNDSSAKPPEQPSSGQH